MSTSVPESQFRAALPAFMTQARRGSGVLVTRSGRPFVRLLGPEPGERISAADAHDPALLRRVAGGEVLVLTEAGTDRAMLVPPAGHGVQVSLHEFVARRLAPGLIARARRDQAAFTLVGPDGPVAALAPISAANSVPLTTFETQVLHHRLLDTVAAGRWVQIVSGGSRIATLIPAQRADADVAELVEVFTDIRDDLASQQQALNALERA